MKEVQATYGVARSRAVQRNFPVRTAAKRGWLHAGRETAGFEQALADDCRGDAVASSRMHCAQPFFPFPEAA